METQREQRAIESGRHAGPRRRALLILAGIGLLLLVLGTAEACYSHNFKSNTDGWYGGNVITAAGPVKADGSIITVSSRTVGHETCMPDLPNSVEVDWDWGWVRQVDIVGEIAVVGASGEGGYATDWWDCILFQEIEWYGTHSWAGDPNDGEGEVEDYGQQTLRG